MKLTLLFAIAILALTTAAPGKDDDLFIMDTSLVFGNFDVVYSSKYNIDSLTFPINGVNFDENSVLNESTDMSVFFVETDVNDNGEKVYKGLYVFKDHRATKLLENGTHSTADMSNTKKVYMSATDGIYVYDSESGKVERYGSVTDNIINIAKLSSKDEFYILTADNVVYKVIDNGERKLKIDNVIGAKQIILDNLDNLYFYGADKQPHVLTEGGIKKIQGLPSKPNSVNFYKPPFICTNIALFLADHRMYFMKADGSSEMGNEYQPNLTAFDLEAMFIYYFATDKTIWYLLYPSLIDDAQVASFKRAFRNKAGKIQAIATRVKARHTKLSSYY